MTFACFIIATASCAQTPTPVEVQIHHVRASKALELMNQAYSPSLKSANLQADDAKGLLTVQGTPETVQEVRQLVKLFDHARRKLSIRVSVDSEVDKESYQVSAKIMEMQQWKTVDGD